MVIKRVASIPGLKIHLLQIIAAIIVLCSAAGCRDLRDIRNFFDSKKEPSPKDQAASAELREAAHRAREADKLEAEAVLRAFKEAYPLILDSWKDYWPIFDCLWGKKRYDSKTHRLKVGHQRCLSRCEKRYGGEDGNPRLLWNCKGPCFRQVRGGATFRARKACYTKYVKQLAPLAEQAEAKKHAFEGTARQIWESIANGVEKATAAKVAPYSADPPNSAYWEIEAKMSQVTTKYFQCFGAPCSARTLAGLLGLTDTILLPPENPTCSLWLHDGRRVDRKTLTVR